VQRKGGRKARNGDEAGKKQCKDEHIECSTTEPGGTDDKDEKQYDRDGIEWESFPKSSRHRDTPPCEKYANELTSLLLSQAGENGKTSVIMRNDYQENAVHLLAQRHVKGIGHEPTREAL